MAREFEIIRTPLRALAQGVTWSEWQSWFERLFRYVENTVLRGTTSGDAAATILPNQSYHGVTALTAGRTLTLPATSSLEDNHLLIIQDESGSGGTHTITIQRAGSDTINGATNVTITSNYGRRTLIKSGAGKWFSA
jgi:hypothetical protein